MSLPVKMTGYESTKIINFFLKIASSEMRFLLIFSFFIFVTGQEDKLKKLFLLRRNKIFRK